MEDYIFKRVSKDSYADLLVLHKAAFGVAESTTYYPNKMATEHLGITHLGYLAYTKDNKPAAFYGVYPYQIEYKGKLHLACQSGDTMTHPQHTGKGLFTTLAKLTYQLAEENGVGFVFGFPNDNSYHGFTQKLAWIHKENMQNYTARVNTIPLAAAAKKFSMLTPLYKLYSNTLLSFYKSKAQFQSNSALGYRWGGVYRDAGYTKYKSFNNNHIITIAGQNVWLKADGALLIGDITIVEKRELPLLISGIKRLALLLGCNKVLFAVGKDTPWDLMLRGEMECAEGIYIGYRDFNSGLPLEEIKYMMADYDTF